MWRWFYILLLFLFFFIFLRAPSLFWFRPFLVGVSVFLFVPLVFAFVLTPGRLVAAGRRPGWGFGREIARGLLHWKISVRFTLEVIRTHFTAFFPCLLIAWTFTFCWWIQTRAFRSRPCLRLLFLGHPKICSWLLFLVEIKPELFKIFMVELLGSSWVVLIKWRDHTLLYVFEVIDRFLVVKHRSLIPTT